MSHLGERVSPLVDGQLGPDAAERALMHIAGCPECHDAVEVERLTKQRLAALGVPRPGGDFMHRLLEMSGPSGPMPPRPGHVPGSPRPELVKEAGRLLSTSSTGSTSGALRPPGRRGSSRPALVRPASMSRMVRVSRSSRTRMAAAMVGAVCLVGAGVTGGVANGGVVDQRVAPPVDSFVLEHSATTSTLPFADQTVVWRAVGAGR
jgi:anti-sigma factor RsiW